MSVKSRLVFPLTGLLMFFISCKREDEVGGPGMATRLREFEAAACSGGTVTRHDFQGRQVYTFNKNCGVHPDEAFPVFDEDGNAICSLGGIAGNMNCLGVRFAGNATNPVIIYTKP